MIASEQNRPLLHSINFGPEEGTMARVRVMRSFTCELLSALAVVGAGCGGGQAPSPTLAASPEVMREIILDSVARGVDTPWGIAFAPDGRTFVTERPGGIRVIDKNGLRPEPWAVVDVLPMTYETEGG